MIWGPDGKKLSKRHGATSVEAFRDEGFLPEALLNYLALLGWSLDGETTIVTAEQLKANFTLERISKNPAIFDIEKLEWMNGVYIRQMAPAAFVERMMPYLESAGLATQADAQARPEWYEALAPLVAERVKRMTEVAPMVAFLFSEEVVPDAEAASRTLAQPGARDALSAAARALADSEEWSAAAIEQALRAVPETLGIKPKAFFQTVRVALTGSLVSLPLFESVMLLGRERALARLEAAMSRSAG
jgi:glutamyl-tRNA synthetase